MGKEKKRKSKDDPEKVEKKKSLKKIVSTLFAMIFDNIARRADGYTNEIYPFKPITTVCLEKAK